MSKKKIKILVFLLILFSPLVSVRSSTIVSSHAYAWSNNVGYINFENVIVDDTGLSGYAWSANKGFINFSPTHGRVLNDGTGNLFGFAWGEQLGWIDFDAVSINPVTGKFSGTATGIIVGTLTFDCPNFCDVETDWREASSDAVASGSGGNRGGSFRVFPNTTNVANADMIIIDSNTALVPNTPSLVFASGSSKNTATVFATPDRNSPLFDVVSEPIQSLPDNTISLIVFPTIVKIFLVLLVVFVVRRATRYFMARAELKEKTNLVK